MTHDFHGPVLSRTCERVEPEVVDLVRQLARARNHRPRQEGIARCVQGALEALGYDLVFRDEVGNVVGVLTGSTEGPALLLTSHMDAARPRDPTSDEDLLPGAIRRGQVHGVGTAACKGALAVQVYGGQVLQATSPFFRGTLIVAATVAEHDGCGAGMDHLLRHTLPDLDLEPALMILGEPTGLGLRDRGGGCVDLVASVTGSDKDAVARSARLFSRSLTSPDQAMSGSLADGLRVHGPDYYPSPGASTEAELSISCRVPSDKTVSDYLRWLRDKASDANARVALDAALRGDRRRPCSGVAAAVVHSMESWSTDPNRSVIRGAHDALRAAGWDQGRLPPRPGQSGGKELGRRSPRSFTVPTLGFGPGDERLAYAPHEAVSIKSLRQGLFGTVVLATAVLGASARRTYLVR